ncbi:DNA cytosine methyltransferase [Brevundimonas sp.]|uniref:DNA cytosine methyltransferase n=1 Tax=Brevundimonas sp. TaxID=1871086 RepID=UPI002FC9ECC6
MTPSLSYGSVCSGIEAASVAWHPLGWRASFLSEIEAFPRAVLRHHYPDTPLHGDFTTIQPGEYEPIDLLVGGTPCQSFSVAGLRGGLGDDRGNLALEYLRLADRLRPRWLVWENVPGVLSSNGGRDFGAILGGMVELGYGFAYRVLDAQYFGVAQRRRRVFVVGYLGDWRRAAAVLFERHSLSGDPAPRREAGPSVAALTANGVGTCGADDNQGQAGHLIASTGETSHCLNAGGMGRQDFETETLIAQPRPTAQVIGCLNSAGGHAVPGNSVQDAVSHQLIPCYPINADALRGEGSARTPSIDAAGRARVRDPGLGVGNDGDPAGTLAAAGPGAVAYAIQERAVCENPQAGPDGAGFRTDDAAYTLEARSVPQAVAFALRGREGGAMPEVEGDGSRAGALRAASGGSSRDYVALSAGEVADTLSVGANQTTGFQGDICGAGSAVRRLTPVECERLQGFPDGYTLIPRGKRIREAEKAELRAFFQRTGQYLIQQGHDWIFDEARFEAEWPRMAADGPRYKALGNSMAVPVMAWIGGRIAAVEAIIQSERMAA